MSGRIASDANYRFMERCTFTLAAYGGLFFPAWYLLELVLAVLNPIDVRSPTESTYLVYHALHPSHDNLLWNCTLYDIAAWLQDRKKLVAYGLLCYWILRAGVDERAGTRRRMI